ncbi:double zinc ribbon domain-containing protein [Roseateles violae]|uniref:Zinc ribbon domain-containing protein n=1 Tax=Roseateles violae TaxID=3058042 RepID=A0ABT8DQC3_9BURK|nr:zinc ribbon domain-containing protein [Pelomonas sp. PFR6]MDN3919245.1 zinc ribbon domain-containing protein [Pelomonas sp. PFR6]
MSPIRLPAKLPTRCPYCAHVSPVDSKFCNECGAALHLQPCPHCGAVNDLTLTEVCGRCGGDLQQAGATAEAAANDPPALDLPGIAAAAAAAESAPPDELDSAFLHAQSDSLRPPAPRALPLLVMLSSAAVVLLAAAAGYYFYEGRTPAPSAKATAVIDSVVRDALSTQPPAEPPGRSTASSTPGASPTPPVAPERSEAAEPSPPPTQTAAASEALPGIAPGPAPRRSERPPRMTIAPANDANLPPIALPPTRAGPSGNSAIEPPPPRIGACTEAVAALGLCNPNAPSNQR